MHVLVTGGAGFIGSHVIERLLARGYRVSALDDFDPYYARDVKEANVATYGRQNLARFHELDLACDDLTEAVVDADAVVHLAAIPGVRDSWGLEFERYLRCNVQATQRLLESVREHPVEVFVYGGSASVYGDEALDAVDEDFLPAPHSPYGVTKLAGEHLAGLYRRVYGVPTLSLRIFSCYGPRERPDKAIQKFLQAARRNEGIEVYGDGSQRRDFTYVGDIADGILSALERRPIGATLNLARGATCSLRQVLETIERVTGVDLAVTYGPSQPGDVRVTSARIDSARERLGYAPATDLEEGIARQWEAVSRSSSPGA